LSAAQALQVARAAGIQIKADGDDLLLEADAPPSAAVLDLLTRNKTGILTMLRSGVDGWTAEDWHTVFHERPAIAEFDGALPRAKAEALALDCWVTEWLNQHPAPSVPGRCAWCGRPESVSAVVLPFGTEPGTHAWLHAECWPTWHQARRAEAIAALRAMGICMGLGHELQKTCF
jgi:hypothetical protein